MLKLAENVDLNQISLTGARAIVLLGLLMIKPCSLDEIRNAFINYSLMDNSHSNDIIRIDLNTLKHMGCEISRASQNTNHKYVLGNHPFSLILNDTDIKTIKKIYDDLKKCSNISLLMEYDELFKKLASHISDTTIKEKFLGISIFKSYKTDLVKDLLVDCKYERTLDIVYKNPVNGKENSKEIVAQKLVLNNDKFYLYGFDLSKQESVMLHVKRISKVLARHLEKSNIKSRKVKVKFIVKDFGYDVISSEETILQADNR